MRMMPCACRWGARSRCQKLCVAGLVGAQRIAQNNSNVKSEPITWHVKTLQYVLSTFEIFLVYLGFYGGLTSLLFGYIPALVSALTPPNTKSQPCCPPRPSSPRNIVLTSSCNARISDA